MTTAYRGMRWHKCDLHMHTAIDSPHWRGRDSVSDDASCRDFAKRYIARCYEIGLSVIAVTDHNFLSKDFLPYLTSEIQDQAAEHGYEIVLFPGFEIEADVGKGTHVIALFEPDSDLATIDHLLSACGVAHPRITAGTLAKSTQRLPEILDAVQNHDSLNGLVTIPHIMEHGLFDNDRISEWLQAEEYQNSDLLAVEVPKPVPQMGEGFQKLFGNGPDCRKPWKRERAIATLMSSDCKALDGDDEDDFGYIGRRYTWIKMSSPSIEALRQAFLDHDSRITLPVGPATDQCPDEKQRHSRIISISVRGCEFIDDHDLHLSPNFNCIIGGRGSGKSSILEAVRLTLGKDLEDDLDDQTKEKVNRARSLVEANTDTVIAVEWQNSDGVRDIIELLRGEDHDFCSRIKDRDVQDVAVFLQGIQVQFFSQLQLNSIAQASDNRLRTVLDGFVSEELAPLEDEERRTQAEIVRLFAVSKQHNGLVAEAQRLEQEIAELNRRWKKRASLKDAAEKYQIAKKEEAFLASVQQEVSEDSVAEPSELDEDDTRTVDDDSLKASLLAAIDDPLADIALPEDSESWPHIEFLARLKQTRDEAIGTLRQSISNAVDHYRKTVRGVFDGETWIRVDEEVRSSVSSFQEACKEAGLTEEDVARLQEIDTERTEKSVELKVKQDDASKLKADVDKLPFVFSNLHETWWKQFRCRKRTVETINREARTEERPLIETEVEFCGDQNSFLEIWNSLYSDGRTRVGKNWEEIGRLFFAEFSKQYRQWTTEDRVASDDSPEESDSLPELSIWHMIEKWLFDTTSLPEDVSTRLEAINVSIGELKGILYGDSREEWLNACTMRIDDAVDLTLYRADGSIAGRVSEGRLSDGQRNTAVLALLLAQGTNPLVIDQPEDELDSSFVYRELIPMLRVVKNHRQLIFATHNANLPVNGDADLVYALETIGGYGKKLAEGGLDRQDVSNAVLEIMEGSDEAFRKRREKYNF